MWRLKFIRASSHVTRFLRSSCCSIRCCSDSTLRRTPNLTESHHLSYSAGAGSFNRDRKDWLQQTPAHSRNSIRQRRCLSLSRCAPCGASRSDVGRIKDALLRLQHQATLPVHSGPAAGQGTDTREITAIEAKTLRKKSLALIHIVCDQTFSIRMKVLPGCVNFPGSRAGRNIGILPVSSNGHPAWSRTSRLATGRVRPAGGQGSLHDLSGSPRRVRPVSGWKPKLLWLRLRRSVCIRG